MWRVAGVVVLALAVLCPVVAQAQITVSVEPWDATVTVGQTFEMEYWIGNLGDYTAPSLGSYDLTMDFDPALVSYSSTTVGDFLGDVGAGEATATITPLADGVNVVESSNLSAAELDALQPRSFIVFRVQFVAEAVGDASFEPMVTSIVDANGRPLQLELGALAVVHIQEPRAIPTLSTAGILALVCALLIVGFLMLRRRL